MTATMEQMKMEAYGRLKDLGVHNSAIKSFMETGIPPASHGYFLIELGGADLERIREFEKEHGFLVYYVMHGHYGDIGEMHAYLYVTKDTEEWPLDREDLPHGVQMSYVHNDTYPYFSELGTVGFEPVAGVLVRTA